MNAKLVVVKGAQPAAIHLQRLPTVIGRSAEATVKMPSNQVSRTHCEVYDDEGELAVRDLGSANGTFVNGQRIEGPTALGSGDLVKIGPVTLRVDPAETAGQKEAAPAAAEPDQTPVTEEAPRQSGLSSILNYSETAEGSFVAISDEDLIEDDEAEEAPETNVVGDLGEADEPKVDSQDSALDAFFRNLE